MKEKTKLLQWSELKKILEKQEKEIVAKIPQMPFFHDVEILPNGDLAIKELYLCPEEAIRLTEALAVFYLGYKGKTAL